MRARYLVGHGIERPRQPAQLIVAPRGHAMLQIPRRNRFRGAGNADQRRSQTAAPPPRGQDADDGDERGDRRHREQIRASWGDDHATWHLGDHHPRRPRYRRRGGPLHLTPAFVEYGDATREDALWWRGDQGAEIGPRVTARVADEERNIPPGETGERFGSLRVERHAGHLLHDSAGALRSAGSGRNSDRDGEKKRRIAAHEGAVASRILTR